MDVKRIDELPKEGGELPSQPDFEVQKVQGKVEEETTSTVPCNESEQKVKAEYEHFDPLLISTHDGVNGDPPGNRVDPSCSDVGKGSCRGNTPPVE